jgi:hypothetical protein
MGYASADYFIKERDIFFDWSLKPGTSASEAVRAWLRGLTIAECATTLATIYYSAILAFVGDERFDRYFGAPDPSPNAGGKPRLTIRGGMPDMCLKDFVKEVSLGGSPGQRTGLKIGHWYYFKNDPRYITKHPNGLFQGENALFVGEVNGRQTWAGLGVEPATEEEMLDDMAKAFNRGVDPAEGTSPAQIVESGGGLGSSGFALDPEKVKKL